MKTSDYIDHLSIRLDIASVEMECNSSIKGG